MPEFFVLNKMIGMIETCLENVPGLLIFLNFCYVHDMIWTCVGQVKVSLRSLTKVMLYSICLGTKTKYTKLLLLINEFEYNQKLIIIY